MSLSRFPFGSWGDQKLCPHARLGVVLAIAAATGLFHTVLLITGL